MPADPLRTPLCALLGIRVPVLLAPMAGGPSTPELAAAVTRAGGLGVLGVTGLGAEATGAQVRRARELAAGGPIGVNVQLAPPDRGAGRAEDVAAALAPFRAELGLPGAAPGAPPPPEAPLDLVAAALEAGATVVTTAMGDPAAVAEAVHRAGALLVATVSTVEEARRSVAAGVAAIIAQGAEAGGHRMTFEREDPLPLVGAMALIPRVVDAVDVPVAGSGAVMDGRGLAAVLALGAQGASVGTRFLLAEEAGVPEAYRRRLGTLRETDTVVSDAMTGRPARWVRSRVVDALHGGPPHLGWGPQRAAVADVRSAAGEAGREDLLMMLAGQGAGMTAAVQPAEEIVAELVAEARAVVARLTT